MNLVGNVCNNFYLHFLLEFDFHNLQTLLLDQSSLLNVKLFLSLGINFFDFLIGFLFDEAHHLLDLYILSNATKSVKQVLQ